MNGSEKIKVWIRYDHGKTVCICMRGNRCANCSKCEKETVYRDRYAGIKECFYQDRYGKSKL